MPYHALARCSRLALWLGLAATSVAQARAADMLGARSELLTPLGWEEQRLADDELLVPKSWRSELADATDFGTAAPCSELLVPADWLFTELTE